MGKHKIVSAENLYVSYLQSVSVAPAAVSGLLQVYSIAGKIYCRLPVEDGGTILPLSANKTRSEAFSDGATIDFIIDDVVSDSGFAANTELTTGAKTITISNPVVGRELTVNLPKFNAGTSIVFSPANVNVVSGAYSTTYRNILNFKVLASNYIILAITNV